MINQINDLFPRLLGRRNQEGTPLSGIKQPTLVFGRALAHDIKLLLLDQPYEGLAPVIVQEIKQTLGDTRQSGLTIIVEQAAIAAVKLTDRSVILNTGSVVFVGAANGWITLGTEQTRLDYLAF